MNQVWELKNKLTELRTLDTTFEVFGSDSHNYKLNPCLTEVEVKAFESKYNIRLPTDYRIFLLEVGNGGAGPGYGLLGIEYKSQMTEILDFQNDDFLSQPFFTTESWNDLDLVVKNPEGLVINNDAYFDKKFLQGTITIAHYGCAIYAMLVISGEQRGKIWIDDRTNDGGIYPFSGSCCYFHDEENDFQSYEEEKYALSFYDWYDDWLNRSLIQMN